MNKVLRIRWKMMKNKANGPGDSLVSEMLREPSMDNCVRNHTLVGAEVPREVQVSEA